METIMKKTVKLLFPLLLIIPLTFLLSSCGKNTLSAPEGLTADFFEVF